MNFLRRIFKKELPVKTESVKFSYQNQEVLKDISLNLKEREMVAIIGKSGSGKSTFLKLLCGVLGKKYQGKIRIFGQNKFLQKNQIGFVPQEISMIPDLSIEDNIKIAGLNLGIKEKDAIKKADELMEMLKINEDIKKFPSQLSGGQKVRLNIVLSILHNPKILILDEPFVGLDFLNRRILWHFLETMKKQDKSIILTSHLLTETQEHVDRLIILKNGKIFFSGQIEKLKEKLKFQFIYELKLAKLSKQNFQKIKKYCDFKDIKILDYNEKYLMFAIATNTQKIYINKLFEKLNLDYKEIGFREPNLDEVFLGA
jgi:ABC-2 type transport system ATP-binding protein